MRVPIDVSKSLDYIVLAAPISKVLIIGYDSMPWDRYREATNKGVEELKRKAKNDPKMFDGPLARVNLIQFVDDTVLLQLQKTSFFPYIITRDCKENESSRVNFCKPPDDSANPLSIGGLTVTIGDETSYLWLGKKNPKANEIGGGQYQLSPAGYVNPDQDFSLQMTDARERLEEMLYFKMPRKAVDNQLQREFLQRAPLELSALVISAEPFAIIDRYKARNPWVLFLSFINLTKMDVLEGFKAHKLAYQADPKGVKRPEFDTMEPIEFSRKAIKEFYHEHLDELRPHARGSLQAAIMFWDEISKRKKEVEVLKSLIKSTNL